jgi:hypothetical protein
VNFDDQDWEQAGHPDRSAYRDTSTPWKVAAGVAAGMAIGAMLVFALDRLPSSDAPPAAASAGGSPVPEAPRAGGAPAESAPAPAPAPGSGVARAHAPAAESIASTRPARAAVGEAVQRAAQQAAERRDRAWARFYQKPAYCDDNPSKANMVECANHYIRARREFEALYGPDKP